MEITFKIVDEEYKDYDFILEQMNFCFVINGEERETEKHTFLTIKKGEIEKEYILKDFDFNKYFNKLCKVIEKRIIDFNRNEYE